MNAWLLRPLFLLLAAATAWAQSLEHVRLRNLAAPALASELEREGFDVVEGSVSAGTLELVVSPPSRVLLEARGFELELLAVGRPYYEIQREELASAPDGSPPSGYSDLTGVYARMNAAAASFPALAKVVDLTAAYGTPPTAQNRHLFAIKISDNAAADEDEPNLLIVAEHHAREIVTPEIALTAMENLLNGYAGNPAIKAVVDANEIWIAPVWNPDGYNHVFAVENLWRKNRRNNGDGTFGVDLNRNYSFGWTSGCAGSTSTSSDTYKGPSAASEPETVTMVAFSNARRFAKVIDYHSYGREVLWAYAACLAHPFGFSWLRPEAIALSTASGYGGAERPPTADGEHYEWQLARFSNWAFLIETHVEFQPSFSSGKAEANQLWGGILFALQRPTPLWGHVRTSGGAPLAANVKFLGLNWTNGETNSSGGAFGHYTGALPPGNYNVEFSAPCHQTQVLPVTLTSGTTVVLDVSLAPLGAPSTYCTAKLSTNNCLPQIGSSGSPSLAAPTAFQIQTTQMEAGQNSLDFFSLTGSSATPFQGGTMCAQSPLTRLAVVNSGGSSSCSGALNYNLSDVIAAAGAGVIQPGTQVWIQTWGRDPPASFGSSLSNALTFSVCP